jgi:hypothetical protein
MNNDALSGMSFSTLAHRVSISSLQFVKNDRGKERHPAKYQERPMDAVNELWGTGSMTIGNEECSD